MIIVLIGLGLVGMGLYNMYKDQKKFDNDIVDYMSTIKETLNRLNDKDD